MNKKSGSPQIRRGKDKPSMALPVENEQTYQSTDNWLGLLKT